ncbi:hypothetical protein GCM10029978_078330 [Actinoallomurus acanthiterrae]
MRLADPRVAGHHDEAAFTAARHGQRVVEHAELSPPTDEVTVNPRHAVMVSPGARSDAGRAAKQMAGSGQIPSVMRVCHAMAHPSPSTSRRRGQGRSTGDQWGSHDNGVEHDG